MMTKRMTASFFSSVLMLLLTASVCLAVTVEGAGEQKRGTAPHNAVIKGEIFNVPKPGTISKIEGERTDGFWIENNTGKVVVTFNTLEEGKGYPLSAGAYRVFPNIKKGQDSAWIRITVNCP